MGVHRRLLFMSASLVLVGVLTASFAFSQEDITNKLLEPVTARMLTDIRQEIVLKGIVLKTFQRTDMEGCLRPKMEKKETELRLRTYRRSFNYLGKLKSDIERYQENGPFRKLKKAQQTFNTLRNKLRDNFEMVLGKIMNEHLAKLLEPEQRKALGIEAGTDTDEVEQPHSGGRRLRESDFY